MTVTDDELQRSIDEARAIVLAEQKIRALERLRSSVVSERRLLRVLTVLSIAGCVLASLVGWQAFGIASDARAALDEFDASRQEGRVISCESYNTDVVDKINGILLSVASQSRDPAAARARIGPLLLDQRDCSDKGIADYFDGDTATDPFVPVTIPEEG